MMFQDARLLPWKTVIDNVGLGLKGAWRDAALQALASVGLESRAQEWPGRAVGWAEAARCAGPRADPSPAPAAAGRTAGALDALTRLEMQELIVPCGRSMALRSCWSRTTSVKRWPWPIGCC